MRSPLSSLLLVVVIGSVVMKLVFQLLLAKTSLSQDNLQKNTIINIESIYNAFISNDITKAVVFGGLEPMLQFDEIISFVKYFREKGCNSDIVIYTGYYPNELQNEIEQLKQYPNIILKYGRYKPNTPSRFDEVLQITLASDNQYAERIS